MSLEWRRKRWTSCRQKGSTTVTLGVKRLQHFSVAKCVIYFWWREFLASQMIRNVDYISVLDAVSVHPYFTKVVTNATRLSVGEVDHGERLWQNGWRRMVWSEQKNATLMNDVVSSLSNLDQLLFSCICDDAFYSEAVRSAVQIKSDRWMC